MKDNSDRTTQAVATQILHKVKQVAHELHPQQRFSAELNLDSSLDRDFAFDSLGRVELLLRLERTFDVALSDALLNTAETPRDLLRAVLGGQRRISGSVLPEIESVDAVLKEACIVPEQAETLTDVLEWHLQNHSDRTHIKLYDPDGAGNTISFSQLKAGAIRVAAGLQKLDLQPQEPVVLMLPTCEDYFYCFFGVLYAGGIPCPIYPPGRVSQIEEHLNRHVSIVQNAGAGIMLTLAEALPFAGLLRSRVSSLRHLVTAEQVQTDYENLVLPKLHAEDIAFLQYTSGSTGTPKGVVLSHANLLANVRAMGEVVQASSSDVFVSWLPLYHDMGLIGAWFGSLYHAAQLVIMSPLSFIARPQRWLEAIHRFRGTLSASPNFGFEHCVRLIDDETRQQLDLSSWRCAFNGAEPVSPQTLSRFCDKFTSCGFNPVAMMPVYGLAENTVGLAFPPLQRGAIISLINRDRFNRSGWAESCSAEDKDTLEVVACGRALPRHQLRIVDSTDRELPDRQEGRIQFKGPSSTSGYYRNPEQTSTLFHGDWLETGDLGYILEGELYVTGRQKDLIILAGRNIHPSELETAVGNMEGIRKGCVVAFGSRSIERGTERLVLVAETRQKNEARLAGLSTEVNRLAVDLLGQPVDEVLLVAPNRILKTSSGKVRRSACKALYEEGNFQGAPENRWLQWLRIGWGEFKGRLLRFWQRSLDYAFACYCWGLYGLLLCLIIPPFLLLPGIGLRWWIIRQGVRLLGLLTGTSVRLEGAEHLPPPGEACVFVCNHSSYLDGYALVGFLPRCVRFVAKGELKRKKLIAFLLRKINIEFVERFDPDKGSADSARLTQQARTHAPLFFFPEGTFTRVPGLRSFHLGAFTTACQQQLPVVPMAIRGTRTMLRAESWFPRRGRIIISIGEPIPSHVVKGDSLWQQALALRDHARAEVLMLSGEADLNTETGFERAE
ncbi:AMP-binding protein [Amphritea balenae]|uniref:Acyl-phosphate glycerol 3-phosphate acyltransferase n=1 Tax=Amphritea balenae TaxID=452629 RepID=A0A3P1SX63_9GAMM|nr:AMP-binding protein [Amphritea balenae]RRD01699.1 acyl-phosphate glycerol 3-phosphate acyltransferase [Amphritea balenae]GGK54914.1 acyl-CoA synthetase [Amphritea balenae]